MKKALRMIGMVIMTILMSFSFLSCGNDSDEPVSSNELVGTTWVRTTPEEKTESYNSYKGTIKFLSKEKLHFFDSWIEYGTPCNRDVEWKYNYDPKSSSGIILESWSNYANGYDEVEFDIKGNKMTVYFGKVNPNGYKDWVFYKQ